MGSAISHLRIAVSSLYSVATAWEALERRVRESPGIPLEGASTSFWMLPKAEISGWPWSRGNDSESSSARILEVPEYADIVVIGSGITGCSFVREIFKESPGLKVVMLEARDVCSGATARNGGHITPPLYHDYQALVQEHGIEMAREIMEFRLKHLPELLKVTAEEGTRLQEECQAREVTTYDVFWDDGVFEDAKRGLSDYLRIFEHERERGWRVLDKDECAKELQVYEKAVGAISTTAGAVHPYRLVTGILERLLHEEPNFQLFTDTPCLDISNKEDMYKVVTNRGNILTPTIVHATNGWASNLLEPLRGKIIPARAHMTAQRPGTGLGAEWASKRSFVFYPSKSKMRWDYLTQQPGKEWTRRESRYPAPGGEMMFGGAFGQGEGGMLEEIGSANDKGWDMTVGSFLNGALSVYFGRSWGAEGTDEVSRSSKEMWKGRTKCFWSGIIGLSADGMPWVGKLPARVTGRAESSVVVVSGANILEGGEWICGGYSGEGMVHAWMSAKATAHLVLGQEVDWLPSRYLVSERRWRAAVLTEKLLKARN